ncbi:MAG: nucleotidyltransferase domain-containing protein [Syntrophales bacterium]
MAKIPKKPEEIFSEITDDFRKTFGDDLISIILYGSGASGDYVPGKSDLNFLVIVSEKGIDDLERAMKTVARWRKRKVATPLFMTKSYILSSLDSYPLEFFDILRNHILVFGEDVLSGLSIDHSYLRLQLEREIKGKTLLLRKAFLETEGRVKQLRNLINVSLDVFISIFKALLYLKNLEIPPHRRDVIRAAAKEFPFDPDVFLKCADIKEGIGNFPTSDIQTIFKTYIREVKKLSEVVDRMKV